jgi:hypothetical protein
LLDLARQEHGVSLGRHSLGRLRRSKVSKENAGALPRCRALSTIETRSLKVLVAALSSQRRPWVGRSRQWATAGVSNPPSHARRRSVSTCGRACRFCRGRRRSTSDMRQPGPIACQPNLRQTRIFILQGRRGWHHRRFDVVCLARSAPWARTRPLQQARVGVITEQIWSVTSAAFSTATKWPLFVLVTSVAFREVARSAWASSHWGQ